MNERDPRALALRALRDCGVIRASLSHPAYGQLYADRLVSFDTLHTTQKVDFRLTIAGKVIAAELKPWRATA